MWVSPGKIQNNTTCPRPPPPKKCFVPKDWKGEAGVKYMIQKTYPFCLCCYWMTFLLVQTEECWCKILGLICHTSLRHVNLTIVCRCLTFFSTIGLLKQLINQMLRIKKNVFSFHTNLWLHCSLNIIQQTAADKTSKVQWSKNNCYCWLHFHF
jgi:hypothetical protein